MESNSQQAFSVLAICLAKLSLGIRGLYIETLEETLLCSVLKTHFEKFLLKRSQLALRFLKEISEKLQEITELFEELALGNVRDRILYLLLKLSDQFGIAEESFKRIDFPLTHQEIANMIGATRESVKNSLNELVKEGYYSYRQINNICEPIQGRGRSYARKMNINLQEKFHNLKKPGSESARLFLYFDRSKYSRI